jgi:hypothetical protein
MLATQRSQQKINLKNVNFCKKKCQK